MVVHSSKYFDIPFEQLPPSLAIFPLNGVIVLPGSNLPLNIFEPRYINMILDSMASGRLLGMIQEMPYGENAQPELYKIGCAGRITSFHETDDGRLIVNLRGLCRFEIAEELPPVKGYRRVAPHWQRFASDMKQKNEPKINLAPLFHPLEAYMQKNHIEVDWSYIKSLPPTALIDQLSQNLSLDARDKQALLEAPDVTTRAEILTALIEIGISSNSSAGYYKH